MKKLLHNWWFVYGVVALLIVVTAIFCKEHWSISVIVLTSLFHYLSGFKMKWKYVEILDDEGFPGIVSIPLDECNTLYNVRGVNILVLVVGIIGFICWLL